MTPVTQTTLIPKETFSCSETGHEIFMNASNFNFHFLQEASQPKLSQMAYVTAGTYDEEEILQMELIILKVRQILPQ